ncbi:IS630 family transposase [Verrucomicrobia bacterium LW23]|nr:IS630 family transposase [Verrucomicrobia bacterium LW23]
MSKNPAIRKGRTAPAVEITQEEREQLTRWLRARRGSQSLAIRAEMILACAEGLDNTAVARRVRSTGQTVGKWRRRFLEKRLDGLVDEPRPGAPRKIGDDAIEQVVVRTLESKPQGATHWSTRQMAQKAGYSQSTIGRIWRAFGLKPHLQENFRLSDDPMFVEKVRDIAGIYMDPPVNALVLCVDEKSQIQALERTQPLLPLRPGQPERVPHDYARHGTLTLFAALDIATGHVLTQLHKRHRAKEFHDFLNHIDRHVPPDLDVHLILDNYSTHKTPLIRNWLLKRPRYHLHFTPTHASWLNQVERWFGMLTQRQIKRGSHRSTAQLAEAIEAFTATHNQSPRPFRWVKTADEILSSIARFAQRTLDAHT